MVSSAPSGTSSSYNAEYLSPIVDSLSTLAATGDELTRPAEAAVRKISINLFYILALPP